jgi:tetratricopeptide (TPR) repeat protein
MAKVSLRAYNREIEAMIDRNHLDEAVAHSKHILKTFPKHLETYRLLGKAYLEYKRYPDAVDIFSRVLVVVPNDFVANVGMSIIRDEENKLDDAIWHMERAFETQPSNAAIQSELQRLYSRRDGVQLPRIRMTHGALAHMYVKGELYPQAISEIKNVLKEDPERNDMQSLLARAYYHSGAKNDAAEAASALLRREPYALDANRILVEILGADHPENVQAYRQRVIELDPYAAQVSGSIFLSDEVPDVAVTVERLDWNGQPVGMQPDWESRQAISLESGKRAEEEPDWLRNTFSETPPLVGQPSTSPFDAAPLSAGPAVPAEDLPDFLRDAGWGQSTGAFDESKSAFAESQPASSDQALAPGDLPDWVKAMAPEQPAESSPAQEEELPDWINKIDKSALPAAPESTDQPDWMSQLEQPAAQPAEDQPDWLKQLGSAEQPASTDEQPDWLKGFENEAATSRPSTGELDWLSHLGEEAKPAETQPSEFDFLTQPPAESETLASRLAEDDKELLKELGFAPESTPAASTADDFDFLNELTGESEQMPPASATTPELSMKEQLGMSAEEQDDSFAWLENLAAKQGATEGLLTKPEDRLEEEPDWIKQAKGIDMGKVQPPAEQPPVMQPAGDLEALGKTEQEQDDSFAWLESLAAKQGATEGLLTKPEERLEEEPEWVRQAKTLGEQPREIPPAEFPQEEAREVPAAELAPKASVEELGKSEQERDDAFAWLESLAAKHGATEGLLTKPEERLEEEPEWVKQAKDIRGEQVSVPEQTSSVEDTAAWLRGLDEEDALASAAPTSSKDDTAIWFKNLETPSQETAPEPVQESKPGELPDWMQNIEEDRASETMFNIPARENATGEPEAEPAQAPQSQDLPDWMLGIEEDRASETHYNIPAVGKAAAEPEPAAQPAPSEDLPAWMQGIEEDKASETDFNIPVPDVSAAEPERAALSPESEDLPAWMQGIEEEKASETDLNIPALDATASAPEKEPAVDTEWMSAIEQETAMEAAAAPEETEKTPAEELPSWLSELDQEKEHAVTPGALDADLPSWLRDETGEVLTEPTRIEPTRATDWQPVETKQPEPEVKPSEPEPEPAVFQAETPAPLPQPEPVRAQAEVQTPRPEVPEVVNIIEEKIAAVQEPVIPPAPPRPPKLKSTGRLTMPLDPVLGQARNELSGSNLTGALESYSRLIKKGRFLEEVIFDLRDALYRFPVDVDIWQSLGDAYMRANRLQDALDAYTKAEELLR